VDGYAEPAKRRWEHRNPHTASTSYNPSNGPFWKINFPSIPGLESFAGDRLCHSSLFPGATPNSRGKKAVVIGCCNSGHDIAQDFYEKDTT
jgi:cation diffusion facilitator CzcD-associated flavoprotein CzcO